MAQQPQHNEAAAAAAAEYIITFEDRIDTKYIQYLTNRIKEIGLCAEFGSHDDELKYLKIWTSKEFLLKYLSTEENMEQYLAVNVKQDQASLAMRISAFQKLPKTAMLPKALNQHTIHTTLQNINIDDTLIQMVQSKHKLVAMDKLIVIYKRLGFIADIFPIHISQSTHDHNLRSMAKDTMKQWRQLFKFSFYQNLDKIRDYYGEEISFYFGFMSFYTVSLFIPGVIGLLFYITRSDSFDIDESKYMPFYALFVCIWAHIFVKFWNRRASELALLWNTIEFANGNQEYLIQSDIRPEFRGEFRTSPITGKKERYYAAYKRYPKYLIGILITLGMLSLVFLMMICSLNLQGYIRMKGSVIYIEYFDSLSRSGAIFDKDSMIMSFVPCICHCLFVFFLNGQYSKVALALTEWENWKFEQDFENSLILKRFLFEFLDAFLPLFYICFYEMNMSVLTGELFSLFICDEVRRIVTESVLPLVFHLWELRQINKHEKKSGHHKAHKREEHMVLIESKLEKYILFDDYLEMITQFGYITLFASCCPLAAILAFVSNIFEQWSDSFKLCFLSQQPVVERAYNIHGTWVKILQFLAWFGILTNCYIFAFSSEQMEEWFPSLFNPDQEEIVVEVKPLLQSGYEEIKQGKGRYVVLIMFTLEHVIGIICALIHYFVPNVTENVSIEMQKKEHALHHDFIEHVKETQKSMNDLLEEDQREA